MSNNTTNNTPQTFSDEYFREKEGKITRILDDVRSELNSAMGSFGEFNSPHEAYAVIAEELDEFWDCVKQKNFDPVKGKKELRQVAAMAIRAIVEL